MQVGKKPTLHSGSRYGKRKCFNKLVESSDLQKLKRGFKKNGKAMSVPYNSTRTQVRIMGALMALSIITASKMICEGKSLREFPQRYTW